MADLFKNALPDHMLLGLGEQARLVREMVRLTEPSRQLLQQSTLHQEVLQRALEASRVFTERYLATSVQVFNSFEALQARQASLVGLGAIGMRTETLKALEGLKVFTPEIPSILTSGMAEAARRIQESAQWQAALFADLGPTLARALEIPEFLRGIRFPTLEEVEEDQREFVRSSEALASAGWLFPMEMSPAEIAELTETGDAGEPSVLDQHFLDYYSADKKKRLARLARRLLRSRRLEKSRELLEEAVKAYKKGLYRVVITAALPVVEGLVFEASGTVHGTNASREWQRIKKPRRGFLAEAQWCAVSAFLQGLWERSDFGGPEPRKLNRHWVLHGRRRDVGGQADALRLLVAVDFIADAVSSFERAARRRRKGRKGA